MADDDNGGLDDIVIEGETAHSAAASASKRHKTEAAAKAAGGIFKKDVWGDARLEQLRRHGPQICTHSMLSTAYFVPVRLLTHLQIRSLLCDVLTARPKSKKFQGHETHQPWPMWHERGEWLAIPRQFGCRVFGVPASVDTSEGVPVALQTQRPLFTAETCVQSKGIDQETAVSHIEHYLRTTAARDGFASCLFCISPGFGKTCCAAHIIQRLGTRALFVVPNEHPFMLQVADEMRSFLGPSVRVGKLVTSEPRNWDVTDKDIVITTAKSIATIRYDLGSFGLVVVDEAHETATTMYSQMYYRFNARYVLALTATPERAADHCGGYLQWLAGPVVWNEQRDITKLRWGGVGVTIYNLTYLSHPIKEVLLKTGEPYWEGMTRQIIAKPARNRFLLQDVVLPRHRAGRRILIIGTRIEHMEYIHHELNTHFNIPTGIIVGTHTDGHKVTAQDRIDAQKKPILVASVSIVSKALNIPELDTLLVLSGGCYVNDTFWTQCVGRITREHPTKKDPELILIRDRYAVKGDGDGDGVFAACVDAACVTLRKRSPKGYKFDTIDVDIA